jgi:hypothetical protein
MGFIGSSLAFAVSALFTVGFDGWVWAGGADAAGRETSAVCCGSLTWPQAPSVIAAAKAALVIMA